MSSYTHNATAGRSFLPSQPDLAQPASVKDISQQVKDKIKFSNKIVMIASAIVGLITLGIASFFLGGVPAILLGGFVWALLNFTARPIAETLIEKYLPRHLKG